MSERKRAVVSTRLGAALRAATSALWTEPADPVARFGSPGWPVWRPVTVLLFTLLAALLAVMNVNHLTTVPGGGNGPALVVGVSQAALLVVALFRPVGAWWATLCVAAVSARLYEPSMPPDLLHPWSIPEAAIEAGVLLLVALRVRPHRAVGALVTCVLAGMLHIALSSGGHNDDFTRVLPYFVGVTVLGIALRGLRVARGALQVQEELTEEERTRRTVLEERARIARELHDVVAHHMSVVSIQAQVAPHLVENPTAELRENLAGIRASAVEALTELRRVLGVLRSEVPDAEVPFAGPSAPGERPAAHLPQPTLDRLDELLDSVRATGLDIELRRTGVRHTLSPGVELSAYRIVQESLSNVLRHAPGAAVRVTVGHQARSLTLRVSNGVPGHPVLPSPGAGLGQLGMRERVAMLDGELAVGPTPDGGYEVTAILPASASAGPDTDTRTSPPPAAARQDRPATAEEPR